METDIMSCGSMITNNILNPSFKIFKSVRERHVTWFIQISVLPKWREWITKRLGDASFLDKGPYKLRIIDKEYDVHLVSIIRTDDQTKKMGIFSFKWMDNGAIISDLEGFSKLKELIREYKLEQFVDAIQTWQGETIKIVTVKKIEIWSMLMEFSVIDQKLIEPNSIAEFSVCEAFPWFQPTRLPSFDKQSVNDEFFVGLITYLQCQRELCYDMKSEFTLNVIELCSLKLAFCPEFGIESRACTELAHEIDDLIIDSLNRLAKDHSNGYFHDNHFNFLQYANDREVDVYELELACFYFIYNFQDWFEYIIAPILFVNKTENLSINLAKEHKFVLSRLSKLSLYDCDIDGTDFSDMDFKLFSDILKCGNVRKIILDTNYRWLNANEPKYLFQNKRTDFIQIEFIGDNKFNLIEDCIECLKFIKTAQGLNLSFIKPKITNFIIFKNLHVKKIVFMGLILTSSVLHELIDCEFTRKTWIMLDDSRIEGDVDITLLNQIKSSSTWIIEEENTWQYLYDSIVNQIQKSQSNEFTFANRLLVEYENDKFIELRDLKFTIDETGLRLELGDRYTNKILDLFDLKKRKENQEEGDSDEEPSSKRQCDTSYCN